MIGLLHAEALRGQQGKEQGADWHKVFMWGLLRSR
jgi:hypothetical protein